jgi:hypothetical protein
MTILDYCGPLEMLEAYDVKIIQMLIDELGLKDIKMFSFLRKIDISRDVEYFYYDDKNDNILGGFHTPSKNVIYLNLNGMVNDTYIQRANNVVMMFPTILHELCHYYQRKKMGMILYGLCQLPFIRRATIEVSAYKISDYLDKRIEEINKMTPFDFTMLKVKHKFSKWQYDKFEKRILEKEGLWEYV